MKANYMTVKIMLDAPTLRSLLDQHKEAEIEILANVIPQIVNYIKERERREERTLESRVSDKFDELQKAVVSTYSPSSVMVSIVRNAISDIMKAEILDEARQAARQSVVQVAQGQISMELAKLNAKVEESRNMSMRQLDDYIRAKVEQEIMMLLRGGRLVVKDALD